MHVFRTIVIRAVVYICALIKQQNKSRKKRFVYCNLFPFTQLPKVLENIDFFKFAIINPHARLDYKQTIG